MSRTIKKGATSQSIYIEVLDSTSTTGGRKTGLAFDTASLTAYYVRNGGAATSITLATLAAANSAWSSGGFKEVDATNMPGVYRLDVPDAALAAGAESVVITLKGATGMVQVSSEVQLVDAAPGDVVSFLGTAITESAAGRIAGAFTTMYDVATARFTASCFNNSGDPYARLGAPAGATVSVDIAAVTLLASEVWALMGLDSSNPMTVTPTARDAGAGIHQDITGDGVTTTTVTRA